MTLDITTAYAAVACAAATMLVGFLWYGPVFGKIWSRATGMDRLSEAERQQAQKAAMPGYAVSLVGSAVAAVLLDFLVDWAQPGSPYAGASGALAGVSIAFTAFLAFHVPSALVTQFFEKRHPTVLALGVAYWGVLALAWGAIVGALS